MLYLEAIIRLLAWFRLDQLTEDALLTSSCKWVIIEIRKHIGAMCKLLSPYYHVCGDIILFYFAIWQMPMLLSSSASSRESPACRRPAPHKPVRQWQQQSGALRAHQHETEGAHSLQMARY